MPWFQADSSGRLELVFTDAEDMRRFLKTVVKPVAKSLSIEVHYRTVRTRRRTTKMRGQRRSRN